MTFEDTSFWKAFTLRKDLGIFQSNALSLFALQLKFGIEDISLVGLTSITEGSDDKKADMVYIDPEAGYAVIIQSYMSEKHRDEAPANKASDLNTAVSWLLSPHIDTLPLSIKSHAKELRSSIESGDIQTLYIWYVHNLPESKNVKNELKTVEITALAAIKSILSGGGNIEVQSLEVGVSTIEELYTSISTPILVTDEFSIQIEGGFRIRNTTWEAFVTSIPARWLYELFHKYGTKLFSANVRDYLGSRNVDKNINYGIKETAKDNPSHFWVYNNGITALVNDFVVRKEGDNTLIILNGISIVNGAQTTGAIGNLEDLPDEDALVQVRFITCTDTNTLQNIVKYNNSQNKITAPDFRSKDGVQRRLLDEFKDIPNIEYLPRRGGHQDIIQRKQNTLPSITAGQALAAFHKDPYVAYNEKTHIWESDSLYSKYFNEQTTAKHIMLACSLLRTVENKKLFLMNKSKIETLTGFEGDQLSFFRERGSILLLTSAISRSLEIFLNQPTPNLFSISFKENISMEKGMEIWAPIVEISSSFTSHLLTGMSDGLKNRTNVESAIKTFQGLISSTKDANSKIYSTLAKEVVVG